MRSFSSASGALSAPLMCALANASRGRTSSSRNSRLTGSPLTQCSTAVFSFSARSLAAKKARFASISSGENAICNGCVRAPAKARDSARRQHLAHGEDDLLPPGALGDGAQVVERNTREQAQRDRHRGLRVADQRRADARVLAPLGMVADGLERLRRE